MKHVIASLVALGVIGLAFGATTVQGTTRYGVACVKNQTNQSIWFQVQIANGAWEVRQLQPGWETSFSHRYDHQNENRSPDLHIRFDSDLRAQRQFAIQYKLPRRAAVGQSCAEGKPYAFQYEPGNRNFVDLKAL
jgi:hypothetical protein